MTTRANGAREPGTRATSAVTGLIAGTLMSRFGFEWPVVAATVWIVVAVASTRARPIAGPLTLGLCVGPLCYIVLGVIQDPGSSSESGTGQAG